VRISKYNLIDSSYGWGYLDDPYITNDVYVRGDTSIEWTIYGAGRFAINLSDMIQQVFEEDTAYHAISVYVNGNLKKVDDSILTETTDFGITLDLTGDVSEIELVFSSSLNKTGNLTYIKKLSSFLLVNSPEETVRTTVPIDSDSSDILDDEDLIKANGIRIASVDFNNVCGPYSVNLLPDTEEFHLLDGDSEVWFTGDRSTEVSYSITLQARNTVGSIINSKTLQFSIQDCNSSQECQAGGGGGGRPPDDDPDPTLDTPTNLSATLGLCGTLDSESDEKFITTTFSWSGNADGFDFQVSRGNTFNLIDLSHMGMIGNLISGHMPINSLFFFRVRSRSAVSNAYSEWSSVRMFRTDVDTIDCSGVLLPIDDPEYLPVICPDGTPPGGPLEPPIDPSPNPNPNPNPTPTNPTNPGGPGTCFGNGCGDGDGDGDGSGPGGPGEPGGPSYPNPRPRPPSPTPNPPCVGPGCSGSGPGGPGGPGGEDPSNPEKTPQQPRPPVPTCTDNKTHISYLLVENLGDSDIDVIIKWDGRNQGCNRYLDDLGVEDNQSFEEQSLSPGQSVRIELNFTCPECLEVCVTGPNVLYKYELWTATLDTDGNLENPTVAKQTRELSKPNCGCANLSILDVFLPETKTQGDFQGSISVGALPVNRTMSDFALNRELTGDEGCFLFTEIQKRLPLAQGSPEQRRNKLVCYSCDGRSFRDITSDIIGCEVGFFDYYQKPGGVSNWRVSFQNHWIMTANTNEWSKKEWPDTSLDPWVINGSPVKAGWENELDICVTCCQVEDLYGLPSIKQSTPIPGDGGISVVSLDIPFNNKSCPDGIRDPNLGGQTAQYDSNSRRTRGSHVSPCNQMISGSTIVDGLGSGASSLFQFTKDLGFSQISEQAIYGIIDRRTGADGLPPCGTPTGSDKCVYAIGANWSYLREISSLTVACDTSSNGGTTLYRLLSGGKSTSIDVRNDCDLPQERFYRCTTTGVANWPGTQILQGAGNGVYWNETGLFWTRDSLASDKKRVGASRYEVTITSIPYSVGPVGSNPLP
jgi:hypothetical protein